MQSLTVLRFCPCIPPRVERDRMTVTAMGAMSKICVTSGLVMPVVGGRTTATEMGAMSKTCVSVGPVMPVVGDTPGVGAHASFEAVDRTFLRSEITFCLAHVIHAVVMTLVNIERAE